MKKIVNILFCVTALLAFAPIVSAQGQYSIAKTIPGLKYKYNDPDSTHIYPIKDKVAFSKTISEPMSDGTYWIKLETFATGSASVVSSSTPADIILVLDSSSSMDYDYDGQGEWRSRGVQSYTYGNLQNNPEYYYKLDGEYYRVSRVTVNRVRYFTFTDKNNKPWYLNNASNTSEDGLLENPTATAPTSQQAVCWRGELWELRSITRLEALRTAVGKFIDNIWQNDSTVTAQDPTFPGNRIAIITYDNQSYKLSNDYSWVTANNQYANWFDIGAEGVRDNLKNAVNTFGTHNWTRPGLGMRSAIYDLLDGDPASKREVANLTVVMFTDGVPARQTGTGNTFENDVANQAIYWGYQLKNTYDATLWTVGLLNKNSTDENVIKGIHFLDLLSSNYPESFIDAAETNNSAWTVSGGTVTVETLTGGDAEDKDPDGDYFQLDDGDLTSIFDKISKHSGGSSATGLTTASSAVDIVSSSFMLPEGASASSIKVFTARCYDADTAAHKYYFTEEILADHSTDTYTVYDPDTGQATGTFDVDSLVAPSIDSENPNKITVTGFDYSNNWCGPVTEGTTTTYQGHKVIIMIPIQMNPDAIGGPNVETNVQGSGIYAEGSTEPIITFDSPTVSLPVNIYIEKEGLEGVESAKFMIERAIIPDDAVYDRDTLTWHYVSTVFVTNSENAKHSSSGNPMIKVRGLPATVQVGTDSDGKPIQKGVVYRISEENWSWSYTPDTEPQYTDTEKVDNPFTFVNTPKANIDQLIRHAESKVTNVFKRGVTNEVYDDSKKNTRSGDSN